MAEVLSKVLLSGAAANRSFLTVLPTTSGTAVDIHAASASTTVFDEVWIWATNESVAAADLTLEWTATGEPMVVTIEPQSEPQLIIPGWILTNSDACQVFAGNLSTAGTTAVIRLVGYVNRIKST